MASQEQHEHIFEEQPINTKLKLFAAAVVILPILLVVWLVASYDGNSSSTSADNSAVVEQPESELAKDVDAIIKETFGIEGSYAEFMQSEDYPTGSNIGFISKMEDVNSGTVRVHVQADLTEEESTQLGKTIMGNAGYELEELDWIIVRATDGLDINISRSDIPALSA